PPVRMMAQAVDRHDSGMLEAAGDLRFEQKSRARLILTGVALLDLLQRHLAVQLLVHRHRNDTQAALRVWPENAKPPSRDRGTAQVRDRCLEVSSGGSHAKQARLEIRVWKLRKSVAHGADRAQCGEAALGVAVMAKQVAPHERLDRFGVVGSQ